MAFNYEGGDEDAKVDERMLASVPSIKERQMSFRSEAQRRKFAELVKQGKMPQSTYDEWSKATGDKKLPERLGEQENDEEVDLEDARDRYRKKFGLD